MYSHPIPMGEAFPLVAAESMAFSTPVVAADIGGLGPLVSEADCGQLCNIMIVLLTFKQLKN